MNGDYLEYGTASAALPGESQSGDLSLVQPFPQGVLVGVIDGLGHGEAAAEAAQMAAEVLRKQAGDSLISLFKLCHERLRKTRGVVMSIASLNFPDETMTWMGVGNVEGLLLHSGRGEKFIAESLLVSRGVVGSRLPSLRANVLSLAPSDLLILVTDGIRSGFEESFNHLVSAQRIAEQILARDRLETDDSLVLVARYKGKTP